MTAKYVPIDEFITLVEWLASQRSATTPWRFTLFRVGFENPDQIGTSFGAQEGMRRLNRFGAALASTVRRSDLVSRELSVFWVLSSECNAEVVTAKLRNIVDKVDEFGLDIVKCFVSAHVFPHPDLPQVTSGRQLLDSFERLSQAYRPGTSRQ